MVRFCQTENSPQIRCPNCNAGLDIDEWRTEYGDPIAGDNIVECPSCDDKFILGVVIETHYRSRKIEPHNGSHERILNQ